MDVRVLKKFEKLEAGRSRLSDLLKAQNTESLISRPGPGKWSPLQVVNHLYMSESLGLKYMNYKWEERDKLGNAGLREHFRLLALKVVLASPLKFKAPAPVAEMPEELDPRLLDKWAELRKETARFLEKFEGDMVNIRIFKHPFIGRISILQTLDFYQAHFVHHRAQILKQLT